MSGDDRQIGSILHPRTRPKRLYLIAQPVRSNWDPLEVLVWRDSLNGWGRAHQTLAALWETFSFAPTGLPAEANARAAIIEAHSEGQISPGAWIEWAELDLCRAVPHVREAQGVWLGQGRVALLAPYSRRRGRK